MTRFVHISRSARVVTARQCTAGLQCCVRVTRVHANDRPRIHVATLRLGRVNLVQVTANSDFDIHGAVSGARGRPCTEQRAQAADILAHQVPDRCTQTHKCRFRHSTLAGMDSDAQRINHVQVESRRVQ